MLRKRSVYAWGTLSLFLRASTITLSIPALPGYCGEVLGPLGGRTEASYMCFVLPPTDARADLARHLEAIICTLEMQ